MASHHLENCEFVHALPHGHLGPEGCCMPPIEGMQ